MNRVTKGSFLIFGLTISLLLLVTTSGMALVMGNDSDTSFFIEEMELKVLTTPDTSIPPLSLREYLINGAGYYLDSYSDALAFLKKVEMAELTGIEFSEMQALLNSALGNMEEANSNYTNLSIKAEYSTYNDAVVDELKKFPYEKFRKKHGLYKSTFNELVTFLRSGDVRGAYAKMQQNAEKLLTTIKDIKNTVDSSQFPDVPSLWRLNQSYSESMLFGQYMAGIFSKIVKNM